MPHVLRWGEPVRGAIHGLICLSFLSATAVAESGSMSKSCSGRLDGAYFYAYAYQYAYVYNGEVRTETHTFTFSGVLGNARDYVLESKRPYGNHLVYRGPKYTLLVPYVSGESIYVLSPASSSMLPAEKRVLCE